MRQHNGTRQANTNSKFETFFPSCVLSKQLIYINQNQASYIFKNVDCFSKPKIPQFKKL